MNHIHHMPDINFETVEMGPDATKQILIEKITNYAKRAKERRSYRFGIYYTGPLLEHHTGKWLVGDETQNGDLTNHNQCEVDVEDVLKAIQDAEFTNEVYIFSHTPKSGYWPKRTSELLTEHGVSEKEHW